MYLAITLLLKATVLLLLSILLLFACRKASASLRHWVISMTLIGLMVLPFCSNYLPNLKVEVPFLEQVYTQQTIDNKSITSKSDANSEKKHIAFNDKIKTVSPNKKESEITTNATQNSLLLNFNWGQILISIWLIGCGIGLLKLFLGIRKIYQLSQSCHPFNRLNTTLENVDILGSSDIETPMTWGFGKAKILLPLTAQNWSKSTLETVLVHELAHIQRKDYWIHILSLVSASFYWFHPMVWWMKKRQILEREKACDEYVLQTGLSNNEYAEQLIKVARFLSNPSKIQAQYALPMAQISQLKQRVLAILAFQKERFQFTKIKQWQWAAFYVSLILLLSAFTPIEKSGIVERITAELPSLESLQSTKLNIKTDRKVVANLVINRLTPNSNLKPISQSTATNLSTIQQHLPTIEPLRTKNQLITSNSTPNIDIKLPKPKMKKGSFRTWSDKNTTFRVAVYGNYKTLASFPYVEVTDAESMVVVEEIRRSSKIFRLLITKAPYEGSIVQSFLLYNQPNSWSGHYQENEAVYLWTVNDEWKFLSDAKRDKWMTKIMPKVWAKLQNKALLQSATRANKIWDDLIESQRELKLERFLPTTRLDDMGDKYEEKTVEIGWSAIPYKKSESVRPIGNWRKVGKTIAINTTSGACSGRKGMKFGKFFRNMPASILKNFNFNMRSMNYDTVDFKLQLYQVVNGEISHKILAESFPAKGFTNDKHRWKRIDLSRQPISVQGDILVILEVDEVQGIQHNGCLLMSQAIGFYKPFQTTAIYTDWDFYDQNFAFYFSVLQ